MNESESEQTAEDPNSGEVFSSYDEQEDFIQRKDEEHSLSKRIEEDAELRSLADMHVIDESEFVLPSASCYGLFTNWKLHPNGKHVYGYRLQNFGGFTSEEKTPAGNGVYLSMQGFDSEDSDQPAVRHAFLPPRHALLVVNEPVYFESNPELVFQDIRREDSMWLKLCKVAAHRSNRLCQEKWTPPLFGDMLTKLLCEAGYDSVYFQSSGKPWIVLLMPGRPLAAQSPTRHACPQPTGQSDSVLVQPIHVEIDVSFESQKLLKLELPTDSPQRSLFSEIAIEHEGLEVPEWPSGGETEIDREIRLETAVLKLFFMQDFLDGNTVVFAELSYCSDVSERKRLAEMDQGAFQIETGGFYASKEVSSDLALLPSIKVNSEFLTIGSLKIGPWDFEDAEWDQSIGVRWFWNGEALPFHPSHIFDAPRGLDSEEWQKLIGEADYIRLHTIHPQATCHTKVAALVSPDNEIFIEWLLMLPDEHMRNLGLLAATHQWIEREKELRRI
jgi:hypothetical protein